MLHEISKGIYAHRAGQNSAGRLVVAMHPYQLSSGWSYLPHRDYPERIAAFFASRDVTFVVFDEAGRVEQTAAHLISRGCDKNLYFIRTEPQSPYSGEADKAGVVSFLDGLGAKGRAIDAVGGFFWEIMHHNGCIEWKGCLGRLAEDLQAAGRQVNVIKDLVYSDFHDPLMSVELCATKKY